MNETTFIFHIFKLELSLRIEKIFIILLCYSVFLSCLPVRVRQLPAQPFLSKVSEAVK